MTTNKNQSLTLEQLQNKILKYINYRPRSRKAVEQKLKFLNAGEIQINTLLIELEEWSLINDEKIIKMFAEDLFEIKKFGVQKVSQELRQLGFEKYLIEDTIDELLAQHSYSDHEQALLHLKKKYKFPHSGYCPNKLLAMLARKGFAYSDAKQAIQDFLNLQ
ncbi:MAG: regulatory protein RecX [Brevinemataceae bacterium]